MLSRTPSSDEEWEQLIRGLIKAHMQLARVDYEELAARLAELDVHELPVNLRTRINRGRFGAIFFLQCLRALNVTELTLPTSRLPRTGKARKDVRR